MSSRIKIMLLLMAVGLIPVMVVAFQSRLAMDQLHNYSVATSQDAVSKSGASGIRNYSNTLANQIQAYLDQHPEIDLENHESLQGDLNLKSITTQPYGYSGYSIVFDSTYTVHFHPEAAMVGSSMADIARKSSTLADALSTALATKQFEGYFEWRDANGEIINQYLAVTQVGSTPLRAAVIIDVDEVRAQNSILKVELDRNAARSVNNQLLVLIIIAVLTLVGTVLLGREAANGLVQLAADAQRIISDLPDPVTLPRTTDEISIVNNALTNAVKQVRGARMNMEKQTRSRSAELVRRNAQIEAVVQIAHEAADMLDVKQMLTRATQLISDSFAYYHTGIFLIDEAGEFAVLVATNSEGGERMLAKGHKLPLGETSIVGYAASTREMYIAQDTASDELHQNQPELAVTRAEMALPLKVRGKVIGVLDVQSSEAGAFTPDDIKILQILVDQVALSIQNARLLEESQRTLSELYHVYGKQVSQSWRQRMEDKPLAYSYSRTGIEPLAVGDKPKVRTAIKNSSIYRENGQSKLIVPISLRGQILGTIAFARDEDQPEWSHEDLSLLEEVANQVAPALENARLLEEIQRKAQVERKIGEISAKIQSSLDMETVLKTAIQEVGLAVDAARVQIRLGQVDHPGLRPGNGGGTDTQ